MRYKELVLQDRELQQEAPLRDIHTIGDFSTDDPNLDTDFVSLKKIDRPSRKMLTKHKPRYFKAFEKTPFTFNFYIVADPKHWEKVNIDDYVKKTAKKDDINIVFTNNVTDTSNYVPMTPWILAHRVHHALLNSTLKIGFSFWEFDKRWYEKLTSIPYIVYGVKKEHDPLRKFNSLNDLTWPMIGTSKSAKSDKKLSSPYDLLAELMAQYLITGKVTLNKQYPPNWNHLEPKISEQEFQKLISSIERNLNAELTNLFNHLKNKTLQF